jgi:mediator of RNA polymerase II transcription subunit 14
MRRLSQTEDDNPPSPMPQIESVESYLFATSQMKTASPSKGVSDGSSSSSARALSHQMASSAQGSNPHTPTSPHTSVLSQSGFSSSPGTFPLSSPPSHGMPGHGVSTTSNQIAPSPSMAVPDQSPGNLFGVNSPMNPLHAPSPSFMPTPSPSAPNQFHSHSPASQFIQSNPSQGGHDTGIGSPFTTPNMPTSNLSMASPAQNVWPGSPSLPRPSPRSIGPSHSPGSSQSHLISSISSPQTVSGGQHHSVNMIHNSGNAPIASARLLPQRPWAAAVPTVLTHQGFDSMCRQNSGHENLQNAHLLHNSVYYSLSQLERFLGCVFMRRNLQRHIQQDESVMHFIESCAQNSFFI